MKKNISIIEQSGRLYGSELSLLDIIIGLDKTQYEIEVIIPKKCDFMLVLSKHGIKTYEFLRINFLKQVNTLRFYSYSRIILHWLIKRPDLIYINQAGILRGVAFCNIFYNIKNFWI